MSSLNIIVNIIYIQKILDQLLHLRNCIVNEAVLMSGNGFVHIPRKWRHVISYCDTKKKTENTIVVIDSINTYHLYTIIVYSLYVADT